MFQDDNTIRVTNHYIDSNSVIPAHFHLGVITNINEKENDQPYITQELDNYFNEKGPAHQSGMYELKLYENPTTNTFNFYESTDFLASTYTQTKEDEFNRKYLTYNSVSSFDEKLLTHRSNKYEVTPERDDTTRASAFHESATQAETVDQTIENDYEHIPFKSGNYNKLPMHQIHKCVKPKPLNEVIDLIYEEKVENEELLRQQPTFPIPVRNYYDGESFPGEANSEQCRENVGPPEFSQRPPYGECKLFLCEVCGRIFKRGQYFQKHMSTHNSGKQNAKSDCQARRHASSDLKRHLNVQPDNKPLTCPHCSFNFESKTIFLFHLRCHSNRNEESYHCSISTPPLITHERRTQGDLDLNFENQGNTDHLKGRPGLAINYFEGPEKQNSLNTSQSIFEEALFERNKEETCSQSSDRFSYDALLLKNLRVREDEDDKFFSLKDSEQRISISTYTGHRSFETHNGENGENARQERSQPSSCNKLFSCEFCHGQFTSRQSLVAHMACHSNETPYWCDTCPAKFKRRHSLRQHLLTHSKKKPKLPCSTKFSRDNQLRSQMQSQIKEKLISRPLGPARFIEKRSINLHLSLHSHEMPYLCSHCPEKFKKRQQVMDHIERSHNRWEEQFTIC